MLAQLLFICLCMGSAHSRCFESESPNQLIPSNGNDDLNAIVPPLGRDEEIAGELSPVLTVGEETHYQFVLKQT